jgi:ATP-binding cassette subfamily C protein CydD
VLLGLTPPTSGRVLIGDVDLREITETHWHEGISWLPQRPWTLAATVAENIRLASPTASDAQISAAAQAAALTVPLTAQGRELSTGETQRVALARALLRTGAPIALLDEPTAGLDVETEQAVLNASRRLLAGKTALVVAHRPAILPETDRVVRLG